MPPGARDPDVEEAALLLHLRGIGRVRDRDHAVGQPHQEDGVPLQALRRVQGRQSDAVHRGDVLLGGAHRKVGDELFQAGLRRSSRHLLGKRGQRGQVLPPLGLGAGPRRRLPRLPAHSAQHVRDLLGQAGRPVGVPGLGSSAQRDQGLPYLGAVEEAGRAAHEERDALRGERRLEHRRLGVGPEKNRDLTRGRPGVDEAPYPAGHRGRLRRLVGTSGERRGRSGGALRGQPQARRRRHRRPRQHPVRERDDLGRAAVAADQAHDNGVGEAGREPEQEAVGRPGEAVDRLSGVTDDAQAFAATEPRVEKPLLERGDVLVFVHDEVAVTAPYLARDLRVLLQDSTGQQQDVLEVARPGRPFDGLVAGEQVGQHGWPPGGRAACRRGGRRVVPRAGERRLRPLDLTRDVTDFRRREWQPSPRGRPHEQRRLRLDHSRRLATDNLRPEVGELAERGGVKRPRLHVSCPEPTKPSAHLPGGPRREGHGQEGPGRRRPAPHLMGDARRDGAGLSGTGTGKHAHRAQWSEHRLLLLGVEREREGKFASCHTRSGTFRPPGGAGGTGGAWAGRPAPARGDAGRPGTERRRRSWVRTIVGASRASPGHRRGERTKATARLSGVNSESTSVANVCGGTCPRSATARSHSSSP